MALFWAIVALFVLIAVIAALNRKPSRNGLQNPYSDSGADSGSGFTDVSGPADIHFAEAPGSAHHWGHDSGGFESHHSGLADHDASAHAAVGDGGGHGGFSGDSGSFGADSGGSGGSDGGGGGGDGGGGG
jgi:hypothetical protein